MLLISFIALQIALTVGIEYHEVTEELYYYIRKNDEETDVKLLMLFKSIMEGAGPISNEVE